MAAALDPRRDRLRRERAGAQDPRYRALGPARFTTVFLPISPPSVTQGPDVHPFVSPRRVRQVHDCVGRVDRSAFLAQVALVDEDVPVAVVSGLELIVLARSAVAWVATCGPTWCFSPSAGGLAPAGRRYPVRGSARPGRTMTWLACAWFSASDCGRTSGVACLISSRWPDFALFALIAHPGCASVGLILGQPSKAFCANSR
jgi:hypothetical protein